MGSSSKNVSNSLLNPFIFGLYSTLWQRAPHFNLLHRNPGICQGASVTRVEVWLAELCSVKRL